MSVRLMGAALVATALLATGVGAQETHRVRGDDVAIFNLAGHAEVVAGGGSEVVVRVMRGGEDAARLSVEMGEVDGRQALSIVYPDDRIVYPEMGRGSNTTRRVRSDGTWGGRRGGGERVEIRGSGSGLEAWADLVIEVPRGQRFSLYVAAGAAEAHGVEGTIRIDTGSGRIEATDITGSLTLDTGSGRATARGVRGDLNIDTGSGTIIVEDVQGDVINLDTGSGGVRGGGLTSAELRVDTGSGSIELDEVSAEQIVLDTGSGGVDLVLLTDVDVLDVDTGSGSVTIRAPDNLGATVDIETGSGGIDVDFAVQVRAMRRNEMRGVLGDGEGRIRIDTGSGSIRLLRN